MPIAFVAGDVGANGFGGGTAGPINSLGGDFLAFGSPEYVTGPTTTPTDSQSNTLAMLTDVLSSTYVRMRTGYAKNASVASVHEAYSTGNYAPISFAAFSGVHLTSPLDQQGGSSFSGVTSKAFSSFTPSVPGCLILLYISSEDWSLAGLAIDSGFTIIDSVDYNPGLYWGHAVARKIQTTATTETPTFSWTSSAIGCVNYAVYKPEAAGGVVGRGVLIPQSVKRGSYF